MAIYDTHVILSAAISIDGKIATRTRTLNLSSHEDCIRLHKLRTKVDGILVGKNTVIKDNPLLTVRHAQGQNPVRIILDSRGEISAESKILQTSNKVPTIIAVSEQITSSHLKKLAKFPVEVIITGKKSVNIKSLLRRLSEKNIKTILVEGGGTTNWEFIRQGLFDELVITVSPFLIGGDDSVSLVQGGGFAKITKSPNLRLKSIKRLKNHLVLNYLKV